MTDSITVRAADARPIAVAQLLLPPAEAMAPYLRRIDGSRVYSNVDPRVREPQDRLGSRFGLTSGTVATVASGTLGSTLAPSAAEARVGRFCLMPAWTFAASAHAVIAAGLKPYSPAATSTASAQCWRRCWK